jgi:hypothetical protein
MQYARITLTVAYEEYSEPGTLSALDYILPALDELPPEATVLEFDERPMVLLVDYSTEKADS